MSEKQAKEPLQKTTLELLNRLEQLFRKQSSIPLEERRLFSYDEIQKTVKEFLTQNLEYKKSCDRRHETMTEVKKQAKTVYAIVYRTPMSDWEEQWVTLDYHESQVRKLQAENQDTVRCLNAVDDELAAAKKQIAEANNHLKNFPHLFGIGDEDDIEVWKFRHEQILSATFPTTGKEAKP